MSKNELMEKLNNMLRTHDRFYEYADDMRAYSKGNDERQAILAFMLNELDMTLRESMEYYSNFINGK